MRKSKLVALLGVAVLAVLALGAAVVTAAEPGQTVKVKSEITIGASGYQGKVKAKNSNCVGERIVVLKQKGNGVLSRVESKPNGNWKADLEDLNANIKIPAKVFAEVKPMTQATAGPIYKCEAAASKTVEIAGG
ncbi:MAG: hypothetical protein QOE75_736 [Solirubrobacterales bacterium]|jgi:hypothetical protein|nr:hypothetical protein [Solirubrobacterales bacterium]